MINIPKGTKDVLPSQSYKWQYVEAYARRLARLYNAREIRTPVFEHTELFTRSIGEATDVVSKEMYTFTDKGGRSITLKPEGTAPAARCFVENSLDQSEGLPLKAFYITPVFRCEAPQAGRFREHHQFGIEVYGSAHALMDAEVISLAYDFLTGLGVKDVSLSLNSIGCPECRGNYNTALKSYIGSNLTHMCETCRERFEKNPLRILDCKVYTCKKIVENAPKIIDYICPECVQHMETLKDALTVLDIPFGINPNIVRGLDYYTKTVFEFVTNSLGAQGTVCGGGRYDGMVESIGGRSTPCVGFGMGLERLIMLMEASDVNFGDIQVPDIFIAPYSINERAECIKLVKNLRSAGLSVESDFMSRSIKSQLKYADKINAEFLVVIGGDEILSGEAEVKNMRNGTSQRMKLSNIAEYLSQNKG